MSYGLRVYDENGDVSLDEVDNIARLVFLYQTQLDPEVNDETGSVYLPETIGKKVFIHIRPVWSYRTPVKVINHGDGNFSWERGSPNSADAGTCFGIFIYS